ncbi:GatB/YqeY domain-containing protein [Patescibacteria group bacterium]
MSLKNKIEENLKMALKEKKELEVSVLRMLKSSVLNKEKDKRYKLIKNKSEAELEKIGKESKEAEKLEKESWLSDDEVTDTITSEIKKRKESVEAFEKGGRQELVDKEKKEIDILQKYLPEQLSENEIKKLIEESIAQTEAKEIKDMGKVMSNLNPKIKGKADMSLVSKIVKEILIK